MMLFLQKTQVIEPPYKNTIAELASWTKQTTVFAKGKRIFGGMLVDKNTLITSNMLKDDIVRVKLPDGTICTAHKVEHERTLSISIYTLEDIEVSDWIGLPTRTEPLKEGSYLFSCCDSFVNVYEPIDNSESKTIQKYDDEGILAIDNYDKTCTLPVVDRYGYFCGIAVGEYEGETIVQHFPVNKTKL